MSLIADASLGRFRCGFPLRAGDRLAHHPPMQAQLARHPLDRSHAELVFASNLFV